ncbi:SDR family NAD(P)-dependent oxidoreductase [Komagataeibacter swingsii]|uniref:NADP-dependent 3-hydroxy acid dehydrogenase n=1 Tax=Komagataeibacter swingsii TaxID=215220 RepID=A0A2V4RPL6_9PROT|nr:SDR family NAD(P)-dependent oxidoreductase [Komagataeibacter swingsii]PYD70565.1 NADP-dependent 3-hydroxy acid dehydrogenase [Komagataeibacter swingsii]GBQ59051.1 oxidoreductase [Komagataeibacter swingsii DSM 16373]
MQGTVLVTGATAGFGWAIAKRLVADGYRVIATGRRIERLEELQAELGENLLPVQLDVSDSAAVKALPETLPPEWRAVDVLVNNAGLARGLECAQDADLENWDEMIQTNVTGLVHMTRAFLPGMVARNKGHVISIGSTAGRYPYQGSNVYGGTKAFVAQFMRNLRCDLLGTHIRATNIAPGLCGGSEFSNVRLRDDEKAAAVYADTFPLVPDDIAETISWVISLPSHVNINEIEMMPVCQSAGGMAVRRGIGKG